MTATLSNLVNGLVFAVLLAAAVWAAIALTPRRVLNAATRYVIWWVALVCVLLLPGLYTVWKARPLPPVSVRSGVAPEAPAQSRTVRILGARQFAPTVPVVVRVPVRRPHWTSGLILLWPAVSTLLLFRLGFNYFALTRLKRRAGDSPGLAQQLHLWISECGGYRANLCVLVSPEVASPVAAGPWHPAIILPAHLLEELTPSDLNRIGLHETAHLLRRDDLALLVERTLQALFFFHPLVWWMLRRIDLEREIACDDMVIAASGGPRHYAACLARIVELNQGMPVRWPAAYAAEDGSHLLKRVDALLDISRRAGANLMRLRFSAVACTLVVAAFAAVRTPAIIAFVPKPVRAQLARALKTPILAVPQTAAAQVASTPEGAPDTEGSIVEDSTGSPVASAELRFHRAGMRELAADLETDRSGRFSASGLPAGEYSVDVSKPNFAATSFKLRVPSPRLDLRLVRYGVIDGRVINVQGKPLPSRVSFQGGRTSAATRVNILVKSPGSDDLISFRQISPEEDGSYRAYNLPPGEYAIGVWYWGIDEGSGVQLYPDNAHPRFFAVKGGEEYSGIDFIVSPQPSWRISGKIERPADVNGVFQLALGNPNQPLLPLSMALDENGAFHFEKIPAGTYDLFVSGPANGYGAFEGVLDMDARHYFGRMRVQVGGNLENLNVPLSEGRSIQVILRADGPDATAAMPPSGCPATASLAVTLTEPWGIMMNNVSSANFSKAQVLSGLAPGKQRVTATQLGDQCFQVNDALVDLSSPRTEPVIVKLAAAGSISGTLTPKLSGVRISITPPLPMDSPRFAYSDQDGHFEVSALRPGRYRLSAGNTTGIEVDVKGGASAPVQLAARTEGQRP